MLNLKYLRYWHSWLNRTVFRGELSRVPIILTKYEPGWAGGCVFDGSVTLYIDPKLSLVNARRVLLHEMVHQWQAENGLPLDHGRRFKQWRTRCELVSGLPWWP